jgi:hypothetical protein
MSFEQLFYLTPELLAVGAGGGGGWYNRANTAGGGGGGQVVSLDAFTLGTILKSTYQPSQPVLEFTINPGGVPGGSSAIYSTQGVMGHRGGNTSVTIYPNTASSTTFVAYGGGGGAGGNADTMTAYDGMSGGNGGGGSRGWINSPGDGGAGLFGGYAGGSNGGGGGGAGGAGSPGVAGAGVWSTITGANVQYGIGGWDANVAVTPGSGGRADSVTTVVTGGQSGAVYIKLS